MKSSFFVLVGVFACVIHPVVVQIQDFSISDSVNAFSLELLAATNNEAGAGAINLALSPYTIWTLMTIISEGARENTAKQLSSMLKLPENQNLLRVAFQNLSSILEEKSSDRTLELNNAIFTNADFPVKKKFSKLSKGVYNVQPMTVNFKNSLEATGIINKYVARATHNRITELVNPADIENAYLFLLSTLYFKGKWRSPFNRSETKVDTFYDEKKNKLGQVNMMYQEGVFPYTTLNDAQILELPYDSQTSMIIVLPFEGKTVEMVLNSFTQKFTDILNKLDEAAYKFSDDEIYVYVPKFKVTSELNMDRVLDKLGAKDVFNSQTANLLGMFPHYLYVSKVIQKAEIEVDEEGTVASAVAGAAFSNKIGPVIFRANKPFLYFIVDRKAKCIVFAGKVSNPDTLS